MREILKIIGYKLIQHLYIKKISVLAFVEGSRSQSPIGDAHVEGLEALFHNADAPEDGDKGHYSFFN